MFGCVIPHIIIGGGGGGGHLSQGNFGRGWLWWRTANTFVPRNRSLYFLIEMLAAKNVLTVCNGFQALTEHFKYSIQNENSTINFYLSFIKFQISMIKSQAFHVYNLPSKIQMSQSLIYVWM